MSPEVLNLTLSALVFALFAGWVVWDRLVLRHQSDLAEAFRFESAEIAFRIEERFRAHHQVLRGARGLFHASESIERDEWRKYTHMLDLGRDYPGIQGLGFARFLRPDELAEHVSEVRSEGLSDYRVWPEGERDAYSAIVFLEPLDWRNRRALGYDMYSEAVRREAMDRAVHTGVGALSGRVRLVQETERDVQAGVLLYLPVFVNTAPIETPAQRRAALTGWVYSPFRMDDLIEATLERFSAHVRVQVYDQREAQQNLLYDSHAGRSPVPDTMMRQSMPVELNGRDWLLVMGAVPGYGEDGLTVQTELVAIGLVGFMFVMVTWSFSTMRERARALHRAATHDPLTGVPNRMMFDDLLERAISRAQRYDEEFGLLFVDLDRFKEVNDRHGHQVGDQLLMQAVERMRHCIRSSDTLGRLGGDEFVVLLPEIGSAIDVDTVAEKLLAALAMPFRIGGHAVDISASIGIARYPVHGRDRDTLVRHADAAMYRAKSDGRNLSREYDGPGDGAGGERGGA